MTEKTEHPKVDKSAWGDGPWQSEPDRAEWKDEATGLPCLAVRGPGGHWCGYVAVAPEHPLHGKDYNEADCAVHGGLTYASECAGQICHVPAPGEPDNVWWFGFDCAHCDDMSPAWRHAFSAEYRRLVKQKYRTLDYVKVNCTELARQLHASC